MVPGALYRGCEAAGPVVERYRRRAVGQPVIDRPATANGHGGSLL